MHGSAAELDFMLKDAGVPVSFSRGASVLANTSGLFDPKQLVQPTNNGYDVVGRDLTVVIRDGTHGATTLDDVATIGGVAYRVRDLGLALADGTRVLTLAGG